MLKNLCILVAVAVLLPHVTADNKGCCTSYTINHVYSSDGPSVNQVQASSQGCANKGDVGPPGKSGPPGVGIKGSKGDSGSPGVDYTEIQRLQEENKALLRRIGTNKWTERLTGCQCYFNRSSYDCACCQNGGCACPKSFRHQCVKCNHGQLCGKGPRTCDDIDRQGVFLISPNEDLVQPFYVRCELKNNLAVSLVSHDSLDETLVRGYEAVLSYTRNIHYNTNLIQIEALINASHSCKQYIRYRCLGSVLLFNGSQYGAWASRDGQVMRYWGGATSRRDYFCQCGETGSCSLAQNKCNCDRNDGLETADEGYITDKNKLPVTKLLFGDTGDAGEKGWHTLGKLECTGTAEN